MNRVRYAILVATLAFAGCSSPQPVRYLTPTPVDSKHTFEKNYVIGEPRQAFVGEPIVRVKDYWQTLAVAEALAADRAFSLHIPFVDLPMPAGTRASVTGSTGDSLRVVSIEGKLQAFRFALNPDGTLHGRAMNQVGAWMAWRASAEPAVRFLPQQITSTDTTKGWSNFELVYGGRTGDAITVLYREYTPDDMARPAFTQTLTYALAEKTIRFRNIAMSVESADNQSITYVVTADGLQ